ncbi:MAG TPA: GNAT family N-acetyltransferase [Candidatus Kapabacteria bacterium]|jgi:GNAT superfamily N-acetyltransferase|nr:GNAT family N-acetyltransferase [Candidatus Kapabacteria bacterium]
MSIRYTTSLDGIEPEMLDGFFEGWPSPPSPATHLAVLRGSHRCVLALDGDRVVGFITAVSDTVLTAFIPLLEVLPEHRGNGIGGELVRRMLAVLDDLYSIDLVCDESLVGFYATLGLTPGRAMMRRNYSRQSGSPT